MALLASLLPLLCLSAIGSQALPELKSPLGPVVNLGYAAYAGNSTSPTGQIDGPVTFFGNIPYVQPPVGDLRFHFPVPLNETVINSGNVEVVDARNWGPPCIQQPAQVGIGSEDCLRMNIWKPTSAKEGDNLPVVVYIHGGGFFERTPQEFPLFDWVNQSNPKIVAVNFGYRLNIMGFLSSSALLAEGSSNGGILDQRAALDWVQRHISKFGGNPDEVTIDGESAGAASVVMQVVAFGGTKTPPFKRAIVQSIGYGGTPTADEAEAVFNTMTNFTGCPSSGQASLTCLRRASIGTIIAALNQVRGGVSPVVDGPSGILPDLPGTLIAEGRFNKVEFMGGHCTNDGRTFVGGTPDQFVTDQDIIDRTFSRLGSHVTNETIMQALSLYPEPGAPGSPFATQYERASEIAQDSVFSCMDWFLADRLREKGEENVFTFRFNAPDPVLLAEMPFEGVMHTSDLYFLMDGTNSASNAFYTFTPFNESEAALSQEAIGFWTSFISSGNPAVHRKALSPDWTTFSTGQRMVLTQGTNGTSTNSAMELTPSAQVTRCMFWMSTNVTQQTRL